MKQPYDPFKAIQSLNGKHYYSLKALEARVTGLRIESLPVSIRIVLESVLRKLRWETNYRARCFEFSSMEGRCTQ